MPHLELDEGFRLYYEVHGPGGDGASSDAPAILFMHGAGGNGLSWWQQVPAFSDRYTVITFDHRAFGRSPDVEDGPGRVAFGTDARSLLDHLGIERAHIVAHSMGGRTAFGLLARDPGRVASLTFSGTNAGCVDDEYRALRQQFGEDGTLDGSLLSRAVAEGYRQESPEMWFLYRQLRGINPRRHADFLKPTGRMVNYRGSTAGRLQESGAPILWIIGAEDRVVPPALIRISHALTPGSAYHEVAGAGHSAYFERPDDWNATVRAHIDAAEDALATDGRASTGAGRPA